MWSALRLIGMTVRTESHHSEELERCWRNREPVVLALWHGRAPMAVYFYAGPGAYIMNSTHRDGMAVSQALRRFGFHTTGGSSSRGAVGGILGLVHAFKRGNDIALVADGPRGPAGVAKRGAVDLAVHTGAPLFPLALSASKCRRFRSWDRLMLPRFGARVVMVAGEALRVGTAKPSKQEREALRLELERRLSQACREADSIAGREPEDY